MKEKPIWMNNRDAEKDPMRKHYSYRSYPTFWIRVTDLVSEIQIRIGVSESYIPSSFFTPINNSRELHLIL